MNETAQEQNASFLADMALRQLLQVAILGAVIGFLVWGLGWLLEAFVYKAILCQGEEPLECAAAVPWAWGTATILGAGAGLFGLVRLRVFRPLLIVIAGAISLWGLIDVLRALEMYQIALAFSFFYFAAYAVYAWLSRVRHFLLTVILVLILVVVTRLALAA